MIGTPWVLALLQQEGQGSRPLMLMLIYAVAFGLIFWFILLRPQRRAQQQHQAMIQELKRGDEVMTEGGILGQVIHLAEDRVTIRTGENTRIVIARGKITRVMTTPAEEKS